MDAIGSSFGERAAGFAFSAGLQVGGGIETVYGFGEYSGGTGFPYAPGAAKQISMGQLSSFYGIFKGDGDAFLTYERYEIIRPVFTCGYDEFFHDITKVRIFSNFAEILNPF